MRDIDSFDVQIIHEQSMTGRGWRGEVGHVGAVTWLNWCRQTDMKMRASSQICMRNNQYMCRDTHHLNLEVGGVEVFGVWPPSSIRPEKGAAQQKSC